MQTATWRPEPSAELREPFDAEAFAVWLDIVKSRFGLSNEKVARSLGISRQALHRWTAGVGAPGLGTYTRMVATHNLPWGAFLKGSPVNVHELYGS